MTDEALGASLRAGREPFCVAPQFEGPGGAEGPDRRSVVVAGEARRRHEGRPCRRPRRRVVVADDPAPPGDIEPGMRDPPRTEVEDRGESAVGVEEHVDRGEVAVREPRPARAGNRERRRSRCDRLARSGARASSGERPPRAIRSQRLPAGSNPPGRPSSRPHRRPRPRGARPQATPIVRASIAARSGVSSQSAPADPAMYVVTRTAGSASGSAARTLVSGSRQREPRRRSRPPGGPRWPPAAPPAS